MKIPSGDLKNTVFTDDNGVRAGNGNTVDFEFYSQMQWREPSNGVIEFIGWPAEYSNGENGVHNSPYTIRNGFSGSDTLIISKFYIQKTLPITYAEGSFVRFLGFVDG